MTQQNTLQGEAAPVSYTHLENRFKSPLRSVKRFLPPDTRGRHTLAPTHGRKYRYRRLANTGIPLPPSRRNRYSVARIR